jgi:glyoxylase-like metal-dependent hydrolase (beta-lactamase superfamily II)
VARTLLGRPIFWGGAYLVDGLLVDCGPPATAREMLLFLEGKPLEGLILTHHHEDHTGAAPLIAARHGLLPRIHALGAPLLEQGFPQELYRTLTWGRRGRMRPGLLGEAVRSRTLRFEVLHTPGHSADHVCLWQPDRGWLFTGDLFLAERLKYLRSDEELSALITSLEAVGRLPVREVFCAHRGPVRDGPAALRRKTQGLRALQERVADLLREGLSESEITRRAVGPEGPLTWLSLGRFSARNFVRSVVRAQARAVPR